MDKSFKLTKKGNFFLFIDIILQIYYNIIINLRGRYIMISSGMTRKVDSLGRIVIPSEIRENLNINKDDSLEIFIDNDVIMLKKNKNSCIFCGETKNIFQFAGKSVCPECAKALNGYI